MLYRSLRGCLRFLLDAWFPLHVRGTVRVPKTGPVILAANHGSLLDPLLLIVASPRPVRFLINEDMYHSWLFGWLVRRIGCILVWRSRAMASGRLAEALQALSDGDVVAIFPEGTITDQGRMRHLRPGAAVLRLRSGASLVPVGLSGTVRALPFEGTLPRPETSLSVVFGPAWAPCEPSEPTDESVSNTLEALRHDVLRAKKSAKRRAFEAGRRRRPGAAFVLAAVIVVPVAWLMSTASRSREATHQSRPLRPRHT